MPSHAAPPPLPSSFATVLVMTTEQGKVQLLWQPSVSMLLPSSHSSPSLTMLSPQKVQAAGCSQGPGRHGPWLSGAPAGKAPVSQVSLHPELLMMLSPQIGGVQSLWQSSVSMSLPSSQISPLLGMPSPQKVQSVRQVRPGGEPGLNCVWSQVSPDPGCKAL